ncbi:uncharacterized protein PV06_01122 [Exophiala oligosperma]|uniref:Actin-like ATPase domain-containing protein n=1 Tax=Exophiala oligosperma TaxID=215243 RepID=A0A0D2B8N7_9EURO|nr:uncharacterized protein PV06_01122 [Exophiala oligosperma]KIW48546.1 hypothetical protein PV06_01122 [Exophiala oligosperma]
MGRETKGGSTGPPRQRYLVVAVDFGTTFSGVAWAQTARPEIRSTIVEWPALRGQDDRTSDKVPTELAFDDSGSKFGFEIEEGELRYQWFKLGIDPKQEEQLVSHLSIAYPDSKALPPAYDQQHDPVHLVTLYLTRLRGHIMDILAKNLGSGVIKTTPIRFTITVPAIWDDAAKARTQKCVQSAGMGKEVRIISEPEAAVFYALMPWTLTTSDQVTPLLFATQAEIREAVPGDGSACGSTFLNRIFARFLKDHLEDVEGYDQDTLDEAMLDFETNTKRRFNGDNAMTLRVPGLVDDLTKGIKRQRLTIQAGKVMSLFEPVISSILTLVMSQLRQTKNAKAVILVGGFGQSPYLRNCIKKVVPATIEVLQPPNGWTAVVKGALMRSLNEIEPDTSRINIASRIARKAYGMRAGVEYEPDLHEESLRYWDPFTGKYLVEVMGWFVTQGTQIDEAKPLTTHWYEARPIEEGTIRSISERLYSFTAPRGPTIQPAPLYPGSGVRKLVDFYADLSVISASLIPIETGADGKQYYLLDFQIKVTFFSAHTEYSLWYRGVEYGKVTAEYA